MADTAQVTAGKPKVGGHVFRAPIGTTLPTDATTALDNAFIDMGYISDDGVTVADTRDSETVKAWGGTPVLNVQNERTTTVQAQFISAMNIEVQKMVNGDSNVTGSDFSTGVTIRSNAKELEEYSYVFEMIAKGNIAHRVVLPSASPIEIGEVVYNDTDPVGYDVTLGCTADATGQTKYEYWKAAA